MSAKEDFLKAYPQGAFPIHTLEAAKDAKVRLTYNIRAAQTAEDREFFQEILAKVHARWPDLNGGADEVKIAGR